MILADLSSICQFLNVCTDVPLPLMAELLLYTKGQLIVH